MVRSRLRLVGVLLVLPLAVALVPAQTGKNGTQYAFLVGCSGYDKAELRPLPYTVNDVEDFKKALLATGFEEENVKVLHDKRPERRYQSERAKILRELGLMLDGVRAEDTVVVALSGHGVHFKGDKTGYFCPVDAKLSDKATLIPMEGEGGLFDLLKGCKARRKLLIVNACRNDPAIDLAQAARKVNLDDADTDQVPEGIAAIYSCREGQKSYFDPDRKRGIFFDHVIRAWQGGVKLEDFFERVVAKTKADVDRTLGEAQVPVVRREYQGEWVIGAARRIAEKLAKELVVDLGGGVKMEFVRIPHGKFHMGSPKDEKDHDAGKQYEAWRDWDAEARHEVEITHDFYLGKYTVTQEQYPKVMGTNPSSFSATGDLSWKVKGFDTRRFPVENVSWEDATKFCERLTERHGEGKRTFRLPTEAEWEYACRAGSQTRYHFGGDEKELLGFAWFKDNGGGRPHEVGTRKPNAWGLFDMHGNMYQWCSDWYGPYEGLGAINPMRTEKIKDKGKRVIRGGCYGNDPGFCRAACRGGLPPSHHGVAGFRVACRLD
jgi:formylglycine-generating enzyme required for sulfatase activity